jgi:dTMP kinase
MKMMTPAENSNQTRPAPGLLIVLEGIDGTGKTTLAAELAEALRARGRSILTTFEPTKGPYGQRLRELATQGRDDVTPEEETELFIADRREHLDQEIRPALEEGQTVIMDRYYYSTMAYQGARGMDPEAIERRHEGFAPRPDLLVLLDLPVEEALHRITRKRGSIPDHFEGAEYLARVREIFLQVKHPNLLRLDARASTGEMVEKILERLGVEAE